MQVSGLSAWDTFAFGKGEEKKYVVIAIGQYQSTGRTYISYGLLGSRYISGELPGNKDVWI